MSRVLTNDNQTPIAYINNGSLHYITDNVISREVYMIFTSQHVQQLFGALLG